jgi:hypothetical protein
MMKFPILPPVCLLLATSFFGQQAMAAKIYQWTDEEGVVHFSDSPPHTGITREIREMEFVTYAEEGKDTDEYSIINQLERMAEWRRQTEEERLARKQLQLEEKRLAQERNSYRLNAGLNTRIYYPITYYSPYPGYFGGYNKGHGNYWRGHHHGKGSHGEATGRVADTLLNNYRF